MGGRVVSLTDYRHLRAVECGPAATGLSRVRAKKPLPHTPKTHLRVTGSYVDSFYPTETNLAHPHKVSPKWWDSGLVVPLLALLCCLVVAIGL